MELPVIGEKNGAVPSQGFERLSRCPPRITDFPPEDEVSVDYLHFQRQDQRWTTAQGHQQHDSEAAIQPPCSVTMPSPILVHGPLSLLPAPLGHEKK